MTERFFENLDPYIVLRLLGENESNLDRDVVWRFQDVLDGGWMDEAELYDMKDSQKRINIWS